MYKFDVDVSALWTFGDVLGRYNAIVLWTGRTAQSTCIPLQTQSRHCRQPQEAVPCSCRPVWCARSSPKLRTSSIFHTHSSIRIERCGLSAIFSGYVGCDTTGTALYSRISPLITSIDSAFLVRDPEWHEFLLQRHYAENKDKGCVATTHSITSSVNCCLIRCEVNWLFSVVSPCPSMAITRSQTEATLSRSPLATTCRSEWIEWELSGNSSWCCSWLLPVRAVCKHAPFSTL